MEQFISQKYKYPDEHQLIIQERIYFYCKKNHIGLTKECYRSVQMSNNLTMIEAKKPYCLSLFFKFQNNREDERLLPTGC